MKLVIVESPSKAKTVAKYLGNEYIVDASGGHVRDLPEKKLGVDVENNFQPEYVVNPDKKAVIKRLKEKAAKCEKVYLATDPDREGEAISWHLAQLLKLKTTDTNRVTFNEISKKAVSNALAAPSTININLVNAQQARRVLDRLVGYKVSSVLNKKIQPKLSAGRVQSATLKLIVDREREIKAFVPEEYWNVTATLEKPKVPPIFKAALATHLGKKLKICNKEQCDEVLNGIEGKPYVVSAVKRSVTFSAPPPPFTTSTLQQDAVNKLRMNSKRCMQVAQELYEGIDNNGAHTAYVTYIRTDSTRVSTEAHTAAREYIAVKYGEQYVPKAFNVFPSKKSAQDAHEAIRPINCEVTPQMVKDVLNKDQYALYKLIYERFLASCAEKARYDSMSVAIDCGEYGFKTNGKTLLFDGYTAIYDNSKEDDEENFKLPDLQEGDVLKLKALAHEQKFTKPPARYTEASLIKTMEEKGIGRPSTYSNTIATILARKYVERSAKALLPTLLGFTVIEYLEKNFTDIVNVEFTARMEDKLDEVEENPDIKWQAIVGDYYSPLLTCINNALGNKQVIAVGDEKERVDCEQCGEKNAMVLKVGRFGKYYHCEQCGANRSATAKTMAPPQKTDILCEKCGKIMLLREGRNGKFLACSGFPFCRNTRSVDEKVATCPLCGGEVVRKRTKTNKYFYGCKNYPQCDYMSYDKPTDERCPKCDCILVVKKTADGEVTRCSSKSCNYVKEAPQ